MQEAEIELLSNEPLRSGAEGFFRHWRLFFLVGTCILLVVVAVTLMTKKQYRSEMKFLLENNRSNAVITPDRNSSAAVSEVTEQQVNSELDVLGSEDVLGEVVDPGWSQDSKAIRSGSVQAAHEKRIEDLRRRLVIESSKKSTVIDVTYTGTSPQEARETLNRFSGAYLAHRKGLSRPSGTLDFFAEQMRRYQGAWQAASSDLVAFQQAHHLVSVEQAEATLSKQISGFEDDLRGSQASLSEMNARFAASGRAAHDVPTRVQTQEHTVVNRASTDQMRTVLVELQNKRTGYLTRYTPQNRLVKELDSQIADTQAALDNALSQKGHEDTTDVNPAWQQVQSTLLEGRIEREALQSRAQATELSLTDLRNQLVQLQALAVPFNGLQEKADQARSNFELFSEKRDQAQIEDAMDEHKLINVAVVESPTSSFRAVSPKPLLSAGLGLLTALFLGVAMVYFAEVGRNTVNSPRELEALSPLPVLATLPCDPALVNQKKTQLSADGFPAGRYDTTSLTHMVPAMQNMRQTSDL